jgi:RNA polymerase sigma-54 factor
VVPRVRVNRDYADLFRSHRCAGDSELGANLQEARWTVRNVEQRFSTILSVSQAILDRQQHFLAYGAMAMKPLALREIAQEVGVHESTVSRVTNNKFMATPCGMFELKYFFSRGLATRSGAECSPTAIRSLIAEMIAAEPAGRPLSDVDIARSLSGQGFQVARRTVTKYRQALRIEPVERRRSVAA